jgi:hypothetical protein
MQHSLHAMQAALRVLAAINEKRHPREADVDILVHFAGPRPAGMSMDEFACDVIQKAIRHRAEVREKGGAAGR